MIYSRALNPEFSRAILITNLHLTINSIGPDSIKINLFDGTYVVLFVLDIIVWRVLYHLAIVRVQIVKIGLHIVFVTKSEAQ